MLIIFFSTMIDMDDESINFILILIAFLFLTLLNLVGVFIYSFLGRNSILALKICIWLPLNPKK